MSEWTDERAEDVKAAKRAYDALRVREGDPDGAWLTLFNGLQAATVAVDHIDRMTAEVARQQEANARLTAELKQALEAHAASFGALATLSAALGDGEVDDYDALAQHAIDTVADRDATIARLRDELVKEELLHDEQLRRALTAKDATIARLREALDRVLPIFDTHRKIGEAMGLSENLIVTPAKEADRG
jgi:chromosome segregation ATPase